MSSHAIMRSMKATVMVDSSLKSDEIFRIALRVSKYNENGWIFRVVHYRIKKNFWFMTGYRGRNK